MFTQMRKNERKTYERRVLDRRYVVLKFDSPEWIKNVKKNYVAWPKSDRRKLARRDGERRDDVLDNTQSEHLMSDYSSDLLTREERLFFNQLFMNESDK